MQNLFNLADQRSLDVLAECADRDIAFVPFCPLAWLLDLAPNILLIAGTRTRGHLTENLGAASVDLDDAARAELRRHFPTV